MENVKWMIIKFSFNSIGKIKHVEKLYTFHVLNKREIKGGKEKKEKRKKMKRLGRRHDCDM